MTLVSPLAEGSSPEEEPVAPASETPEAPGTPAASEPTTGEQEEKRRYPSTIGGAFYIGILGASIAGLVIVTSGHWRTGLHWMAGALVVGALLRSVLPQKDAGMLAVRARWIDVTLLAALGVLMWVLATNTPSS